MQYHKYIQKRKNVQTISALDQKSGMFDIRYAIQFLYINTFLSYTLFFRNLKKKYKKYHNF